MFLELTSANGNDNSDMKRIMASPPSILGIWSTNQAHVQRALDLNPWVQPVLHRMRGKNSPKIGSLRRRTREYSFSMTPSPDVRLRIPTLKLGRSIIPGRYEFGDNFDNMLTDDMYAPVPASYHRLYPGTFPVGEMFDGLLRPFSQIMERIIFMLRTWFRRAMKNAPTRSRRISLRLGGAQTLVRSVTNPKFGVTYSRDPLLPPMLRLTYNPV